MLRRDILFFVCVVNLFLGYRRVTAQEKKIFPTRTFQVSLLPGIGINGLQPGNFENGVSINLTTGYSAGNLLFEAGLISNLNTNQTRGLQLAGLMNVTGANAFAGMSKTEAEKKVKDGFTADLKGIQVSGMANIVMNNTFGAQLAGGFNISKGSLIGGQLSLLSNVVGGVGVGIQTSCFFNTTEKSFYGLQIGGLFNYSGSLSGLQMAAINRTGDIEGKNSATKSQPTGIQVGIANVAGQMDGFQIGLINVAKRSQGTQIGLINVYKKGTAPNKKDGTAVGLVNTGSLDYAAVYTNELFSFNYEISTGNKKNGRILLDKNNTYISNALFYSHRPFNGDGWGAGYGLKKLIFNRSAASGMAESRFFGYGIDAQYVKYKLNENEANHDGLLTRLKFLAGKRIAPKLFGVNAFIAVSMNAFYGHNDIGLIYKWQNKGHIGNQYIQYWPGISIGILIH